MEVVKIGGLEKSQNFYFFLDVATLKMQPRSMR